MAEQPTCAVRACFSGRVLGCETLRMGAGVRLADLLDGLSIACDLGFGSPPEEAMRSSLIATALARRLERPKSEFADIYYTRW
jgi:hypothetical protein